MRAPRSGREHAGSGPQRVPVPVSGLSAGTQPGFEKLSFGPTMILLKECCSPERRLIERRKQSLGLRNEMSTAVWTVMIPFMLLAIAVAVGCLAALAASFPLESRPRPRQYSTVQG